jgi:hypothetical protein
MNAGRITGERAIEDCTEADLGMLMAQDHRPALVEAA